MIQPPGIAPMASEAGFRLFTIRKSTGTTTSYGTVMWSSSASPISTRRASTRSNKTGPLALTGPRTKLIRHWAGRIDAAVGSDKSSRLVVQSEGDPAPAATSILHLTFL
jgi:hypothetical protein